MTPDAAALVALVHLAFAEVEKRQAALPPPVSDRERLERLYDLDQAGRDALMKIDLSQLPEEQQETAIKDIAREIDDHDRANQDALKKMLPKGGWFSRSKIGPKGEAAAFLIVQHAVDDSALMHAVLPRIEAAVRQGEADGPAYAELYDRIALEFDHKPQLYGSQLQCAGGKWAPLEVEDPGHLDDRRRAIGLPPEADLLRELDAGSCAADTSPPVPPPG